MMISMVCWVETNIFHKQYCLVILVLKIDNLDQIFDAV